MDIENLTTSWQNGIAFNAIIHRFRPDLITDFHNMNPNDSYNNCEKAFKISEEHLEIPKLFDSEDIIDVIKPDEKSILTYLSQFYQKFKQEEIIVGMKHDLNNFIDKFDQTILLENIYEEKSRIFLKNKEEFNENVDDVLKSINTLLCTIKNLEVHNHDLIHKSTEICGYLERINCLRNELSLKKYHPPEELNIDLIDISLSKPSFSLINTVKENIDEFDNKEAAIVENYKNIIRQVLKEESLEVQNSIIQEELKSFTGIFLKSKIKDDTLDKMRNIIEKKKEEIKEYLISKDKIIETTNSAIKLFKERDYKESGYISVPEFKKILRFLKLDANDNYQILNNDASISIEDVKIFIKGLFSRKLNKQSLKLLFEKLTVDGEYEVESGKVLKGINDKVKDGFISSNVFEDDLIQ